MQTSTSSSSPPVSVSVLMAVRDGAKHLPETLTSLRALQVPGKGLEFVCIDDASGDETPALLQQFADAQNLSGISVLVLRQTEASGLASALNLGLAHCRGELIARADADDLYATDRLCRQFAALQQDAGIAALSCGYRRIDESGQVLNTVVPEQGSEWLGFQMMFMNSLLHPGVMFRKSVVEQLGGYDSAYWTAQDSDLWARLVANGHKVDNLHEPLVDYRIHDASVMRSRGEAGRYLSLTVPSRLQTAYFGELPPEHDVTATIELYQGFSPMLPEALSAGLLGLLRLESLIVARESPEIQARYRHRISRSCMRHARWVRGRAPLLAMKLYWQARRWQREESRAA